MIPNESTIKGLTMIFLFTDFGSDGLYLGQMEAAIRQYSPNIPVINLLSHAPTTDPVRSSYLLAALSRQLPEGSIFLSIVDPGVGGNRLPVVLQADGQWFVGPDNGLFNTVALQAKHCEWRIIDWKPAQLSTSFHGRDLFAPIAARIAMGEQDWEYRQYSGPDLSNGIADLAEVIYIDSYGNVLTGLRYTQNLAGRSLVLKGYSIPEARTFSAVAEGQAFWYQNSMNLVEIAVNRGRADEVLGCQIGQMILFLQ